MESISSDDPKPCHKGFLGKQGSCRMGFWHWRDVSPVTAPHTWQRCHGKPLQPLPEACSAAAGRLARVVEQRGALPLGGLDDLAFLGESGSNSTPAHFRVPGVCQQPGSHGGSGGTACGHSSVSVIIPTTQAFTAPAWPVPNATMTSVFYSVHQPMTSSGTGKASSTRWLLPPITLNSTLTPNNLQF